MFLNTKIGIWILDGNKLEICNIVITFFLVDNKDKTSQFFEKTFLLADMSIYITLGTPFFTMNNVKVNFTNQNLK